MDVYKLTICCIVAIYIQFQECICQENQNGGTLTKNDFQSYALNMGGTLVDLLRKEIAMMGQINPANSPSTSPNSLGGPPPTNTFLVPPGGFVAPPPGVGLPQGIPLPVPVGYPPPLGSASFPPDFPSIPIPPSGISASGGSTVYSIGTNYAPLTVINVYGNMPPNANIITKASQPQAPTQDVMLSNNSLIVGSTTNGNGNSETSTQEDYKNKTSDTLLSTTEGMQNSTNPNQNEVTSNDLPEQPLTSNITDSLNAQDSNDNLGDVTTTVSPTTTVPP